MTSGTGPSSQIISALDPATGKSEWASNVNGNWYPAPPVLNNGALQAIDTSNNQVLWSFAGDGTLDTAPIAVDSYVIVGSSSGNLYALDAGSGAQIWTQNVGAAIESSSPGVVSLYTGIAAGDGLLVVPAGNEVIAYQLSTNP